jgi:hypothetical protein
MLCKFSDPKKLKRLSFLTPPSPQQSIPMFSYVLVPIPQNPSIDLACFLWTFWMIQEHAVDHIKKVAIEASQAAYGTYLLSKDIFGARIIGQDKE